MKKVLCMALALGMSFGMLTTVFTLNSSAIVYSGSSSYQSGKYYTQLRELPITGNQRTDIVNVALSQVGYQEGNNSSQLSGYAYGSGDYTEYGRWYGLQSLWCAMYVSWCAGVAGISTNIVPKHSYTVSGLQWFMNKNQAYSRAQVAAGTYTPQAGDIIYFRYSRNSNMTNHVGIVTGYSNGTVYTVEGNTSSASYSSNGGVVAPHSYSISSTYIVYICKPGYTGTSSSSSSSATTSKPTSVTIPSEYKNWVFDATYYANNNPHLKATYGTDEAKLYKHFCENGVREGRAGSALFDVKYYVNSHADLTKAYGTDYVAAFNHFLTNGSHEYTRKYSATMVKLRDYFFDASVYYARHKDLQKTYGMNAGKLFEHYMLCGLAEGRVASPYFSVNYYRTQNTDINRNYSDNWSAFRHFLSSGATSQHKASPVVDAIYYSNRYQDLAGYSTQAAIQHYKSAGAKEGRRASEAFNPVFYLASNADVRASYSLGNACFHYISYGILEGRAGNQDSLLKSACAYLGTNFTAKIGYTYAGKDIAGKVSGGTSSVVLATISSDSSQYWNFIRQSDGSYMIKNMKTGTYLTAKNSTTAAEVTLAPNNGTTYQHWFVYKYNGKCIIRPACAVDMVLNVTNSGTESGTKIQTALISYANSQCFVITKVR